MLAGPSGAAHHYHLHHAVSPPRSLGLGGSSGAKQQQSQAPPQLAPQRERSHTVLPLPLPPLAQAAVGLSMKKEVGRLNARDVRRLITGLDSESARSKEMSVAVRCVCCWCVWGGSVSSLVVCMEGGGLGWGGWVSCTSITMGCRCTGGTPSS